MANFLILSQPLIKNSTRNIFNLLLHYPKAQVSDNIKVHTLILKYIAFLFFWFILSSKAIFANEFPTSFYNPSTDLGFFNAILKQKKNKYKLWAIDLFEKENLYLIYDSSNSLRQIQNIKKVPNSKFFNQEKKLIWERGKKNALFQKSLFIQTAFHLLGKQYCYVKLKKPISLKGRLLHASLWVHSQNYPHRLLLRFSSNSKIINVDIGSLSWYQWKRVQKKMPEILFPKARLLQKKRAHQFLGFVIQSRRHTKQEVSLLLDNFLILTDQDRWSYSGAEIDDTW